MKCDLFTASDASVSAWAVSRLPANQHTVAESKILAYAMVLRISSPHHHRQPVEIVHTSGHPLRTVLYINTCSNLTPNKFNTTTLTLLNN